MKVSLSWLREYIPVDLDPQELSDRLTMAGLEQLSWVGPSANASRVRAGIVR